MALTATSKPLTPEQALGRLKGQSQPLAVRAMTTSTASAELAYTALDSATQVPGAYVFRTAGRQGFVVVSADDVSRPLLGYSESGVFDAATMPENLKWWLGEYAAQIAHAAKHDVPAYRLKEKTEAEDHKAIAPMVTTRWNQNSPYNDRCPELHGKRSVTGCMATAEAQVLNYHKYPEKAEGVVSYKWSAGATTLTVDLDTVRWDWTKMDNVFSSGSSEEACNSVASLMYACGLASQMQYSSSESGATTWNAVQGLAKYFGLSEASLILKSWMYSQQWDEFVYNYLSTHGPLLYTGYNTSSGHAFVCDGYRADGYYHINWGWGGMSDGYFLLDALNPSSQGFGGSAYGYNSEQQVITGLYKPGDMSKFNVTIGGGGGIMIPSNYNGVAGDSVIVQGANTKYGFYNYSAATAKINLGLKFLKNSNNEALYAPSYSANASLPSGYGWMKYGVVIPEGLKEGTYTVTPAYRCNEGSWIDMPCDIEFGAYVLATVKGDSVFFDKPQAAPAKVSDIKIDMPIYSGGAFELTARLTPTGDRNFIGKIALVMGEMIGDEIITDFQGEAIAVDANVGTVRDFKYTTVLSNRRLKGETTLVFVNAESFEIISEPIKVNVIAYEEPVIKLTDVVIKDIDKVDTENMIVTCNLVSDKGYFSEPLRLVVGNYNERGGFIITASAFSPRPFLFPGTTLPIEFKMSFLSEPNATYLAKIDYPNPQKAGKYIDLTDYMKITAKGADSGIEDVTVDYTQPYEVYNLMGVRVRDTVGDLTPGIYIIRQGKNAKKILVK